MKINVYKIIGWFHLDEPWAINRKYASNVKKKNLLNLEPCILWDFNSITSLTYTFKKKIENEDKLTL